MPVDEEMVKLVDLPGWSSSATQILTTQILTTQILTRVVELGNPGARVSGTDEVGCRPCHRLVGADKEASAACPVLFQHPAIRALVGVLGCNQAEEAKGKQKQKLHPDYLSWQVGPHSCSAPYHKTR